MILAIDFDRVIHDIDHPVEGRKMGPPMPGAEDYMRRLAREGNKLIIHTLWATTEQGAQAVAKWMRYWGIPFHEVTNVKPQADYYIDDKAVHHTDWESTYQRLI